MKKEIVASILFCIFCVNYSIIYGAPKKPSLPDLRPVPGEIVDHKGIIINPTPASIKYDSDNQVDLSQGFNLSELPNDYKSIIKCLKVSERGIPVTLQIDDSLADKYDVKKTDGAYYLLIQNNRITAISRNPRGAFYAVNTLLQIIENATKVGATIPSIEINDYPELKYRGVVEGFYGTPWSHETRLSMLDFMGRHKMNSYVYGPKDDPYHRTPSWRQPYPESEAKKIRELTERARRNHVEFVWAIHPGGDIRWDKADYDSLLNKFSSMHDLGVRQFAIFFDDIKGKGTDSYRQTELINNLVTDFVEKKDGVKNLIICPTDYNQGWANTSDNGQLAIYGREMNPQTDIFWTGKTVCGDIEPSAIEFVNSRIKRPALVWWNFPVTDYCKHNLLLGPVYGLDTTLGSSDLAGIETNPMENGEASKSAVYGVADYAWNPHNYNPLDNWNRSFAEVMSGAPEAYSTFAIHSCDPPKNYRRNESWNITTFSANNYTTEQFDNLKREFEKIERVEDEIFENGGNPALAIEIAPWLVEFTNLGHRGLLALDLLKTYESGNKSEFEDKYKYLKILNEVQKPGYLDHRSGTLKLQPFIDNILTELSPER